MVMMSWVTWTPLVREWSGLTVNCIRTPYRPTEGQRRGAIKTQKAVCEMVCSRRPVLKIRWHSFFSVAISWPAYVKYERRLLSCLGSLNVCKIPERWRAFWVDYVGAISSVKFDDFRLSKNTVELGKIREENRCALHANVYMQMAITSPGLPLWTPLLIRAEIGWSFAQILQFWRKTRKVWFHFAADKRIAGFLLQDASICCVLLHSNWFVPGRR